MSKMIKAAAALSVVAGLGVAALPLSSYAATQNVNIQAEVLSSISIETDAEGETHPDDGSAGQVGTLNFGTVTPGSAPVEKELTVTVRTNSDKGFTVDVKDLDGNNALVNSAETTDNEIPASGSIYKGQTGWGIKGGLVTSYAAVPINTANALTLVDYAAGSVPTGNAASDKFTLGVVVAEGAVKQGTYTDTIVFTALSK